MTYGLQVLNVDGRTIIDSDQGYPNVQLSSASTVTSTEASRANFSASSNLVFARPNTTTPAGAGNKPYGTAISKSVIYSQTTYLQDHWMTNKSEFTYPSTTYKFTTLSNQSSPATPSEYGLEVIADDGTTTLLMTEGFSTSFDIVYTGVATASTTTFSGLNWTTDSNLYVLMNNTNHSYTNLFGTGSFELFIGYVFENDGSITYRQNYFITDINGNTSATFFTDISNNPYLVVRIKQ